MKDYYSFYFYLMERALRVYMGGKWADKEKILALPLPKRAENVADWSDINTDLSSIAESNLRRLLKADVLVAVMNDPQHPYCGTFTEIGYALGAHKRIIIVCDGTVTTHLCARNPYFHHTQITRVLAWEEASELLEKIPVKNEVWYGDYDEKTQRYLL